MFRYGPCMDTNLVLPLSATKCQVIFDYFLDASLMVTAFYLHIMKTLGRCLEFKVFEIWGADSLHASFIWY